MPRKMALRVARSKARDGMHRCAGQQWSGCRGPGSVPRSGPDPGRGDLSAPLDAKAPRRFGEFDAAAPPLAVFCARWPDARASTAPRWTPPRATAPGSRRILVDRRSNSVSTAARSLVDGQAMIGPSSSMSCGSSTGGRFPGAGAQVDAAAGSLAPAQRRQRRAAVFEFHPRRGSVRGSASISARIESFRRASSEDELRLPPRRRPRRVQHFGQPLSGRAGSGPTASAGEQAVHAIEQQIRLVVAPGGAGTGPAPPAHRRAGKSRRSRVQFQQGRRVVGGGSRARACGRWWRALRRGFNSIGGRTRSMRRPRLRRKAAWR